MKKMNGMFYLLLDTLGYEKTLFELVVNYGVIFDENELSYFFEGMVDQKEKVQRGLEIIAKAKSGH